MSKNFKKLTSLLKELFQLDQPDLDFGLYRVMHAKSGEISQFLEKDLLPQVGSAFAQYTTADKTEFEKELEKAIEQANGLGVDPESTTKVKELRLKIADESVDVNVLEAEVYDHLFSFFRRYYHEGDFLSKRIYKSGVYAIPYEGEELKLHWANHDQYYIKTSEYLCHYAFTLKPGDAKDPMRVHFRLAEVAEGEHGNVKAEENKERVLILASEDFIVEEDSELFIHLHYRPATMSDWPADALEAATAAAKKKPPLQEVLLVDAVKRILDVADESLERWIEELARPHVNANGEHAGYSRLKGHLNRYAARNTFDYFIHKDLGGFLRRELDFYIKNEVMHLDDVENETAPRVEQYLSKIKVIRRIASKLIDFLAQIEDFQKTLWLKKKFIVQTDYCITLSKIPEDLHKDIAANIDQITEWKTELALAGLDNWKTSIPERFLAENPHLLVDTQHFDNSFKDKLIDSIDDLYEQTQAILINAENHSAIRILQEKYSGTAEAIYIDPPYNTNASAILYKNNYKSSSWVSLMFDRLEASRRLLKSDGILCAAIDDEQVSELRYLLSDIFPKEIGIAPVRSNPQSRKSKTTFSPAHEYALFFGNSLTVIPGSLKLTDKRLARYPKKDAKGHFSWMSFIRTGTNNLRSDRPYMFYPIIVNGEDEVRVPKIRWSENEGLHGAYLIEEQLRDDEVAVYPTSTTNGAKVENCWHRGFERISEEPEEYRVRRDKEGVPSIDFKTRIDENSTPITWWDKNEYASANYGAAELKALFGTKPFAFPKAVGLVEDCIRACTNASDALVIDYFAGSGTTAHAVINLNREDNGNRKFILVEMGRYFDSVILPRVKKVTFAAEWEEGKPKVQLTDRTLRRPELIKILRLESYEDAVNNLELGLSDTQKALLDLPAAQAAEGIRECFILRYMLQIETRGSQSLLNIDAFKDPTAYMLKVKLADSDESRDMNVDLLETFNWLVGLTVQHIAAPKSFAAAFKCDDEGRLGLDGRLRQDMAGPWWFRTVTGTTPNGRRTLIIWRKLTGEPEQDNLVLDEWFKRQGYSTRDYEFDLIYVNGDNNLENLRTPEQTWKVRPIEEDFHRLMFDGTGL